MFLNLPQMLGCLTPLIFLFLVSIHATKRGLRIAFGQVVEDPVPYLVSIKSESILENGLHHITFCAGTILNEYWIMTAAHCVPEDKPEYTIFAGSNIRFVGESYKGINKTIPQEYYKSRIVLYDIALLKVDGPIKYIRGQIEPAEWRLGLGGPTADYGIATIAGWGRNEHNASLGFLQSTQQPLLPARYCSSYKFRTYELKDPHLIDDIQKYIICSLPWIYPTGVRSTPCNGDSGSPLIFNNNIIGIDSHADHGGSCPNTNYEFFTKVEPFVPWIRETINQK